MFSEWLDRRLYFSVSLEDNVLVIDGTAADDLISITIANRTLTVTDNGVISTFQRGLVGSMAVNLLDGNDTFRASGIGAAMVIEAGAGDDSVVAGNAPDTIRGGDGSDTLWGGGGGDRFETAAGATRIYGNNGDDTLVSGTGADLFYGGMGKDTADYSAYDAAVDVRLDTLANDGAAGEGDNIALDVEGVIGTAYADRVYGGTGSLEVIAGDGDDTVMAGRQDSLLDGGAGNDRLGGRDGNDLLLGGEGNDSLDGGTGSDQFQGGDGSDTVSYATRSVAFVLRISGIAESGADGENDLINLDVEALRGGTGNDLMVGNDGRETFYGMSGNDTIDGGWGNDTLWGGAGIDTGDYSSREMLQQLRISEGSGIPGEQDIPHEDIEVLIGGAGNDWIEGGWRDNVLIGNGGADTIFGEGGNDTLIGGPGSDMLGYDPGGGPSPDSADPGNDVIYTFDLTGNDDGEVDRITDFLGTNTLHYSTNDPDELLD